VTATEHVDHLAIAATDWTVKALVVVVGLLLVVRGLALVFSPAHATASAGEHIVAGLIGVVAREAPAH
jgi:hypothetical protein